MIRFPRDFNGGLTGFGGDPSLDRAGHHDALKRTPIVLVHGNAGHSAHPDWGMVKMGQFLKDCGYADCEIWAPDHLGENNSAIDLDDPHTNHIDQFRQFVDAVREYLGVKKLDFVAHSLGCGMVNAYLRGLKRNGTWDAGLARLDAVGTFVSLAGGTYGLGLSASGEFRTGSAFEQDSHKFKGVLDDTPQGASAPSKQVSPSPGWIGVTSLDGGDEEITYVAITAVNDFVDLHNRDTGRREGAHVNKRFHLGFGIDGHKKIINSSTVFDFFKSYLNRNPVVAPAQISIDKHSGTYGSGLTIVASTTSGGPVRYKADRVTSRFDAGAIARKSSQSLSGTLASNQGLTLPGDGAWEVTFQADGAEEVRRTYGVNVTLPVAQILTANAAPFSGSLDVKASTTKGTLYFSTDRQNWMVGAVAPISRTATVSFIAIDSDGNASPVVSRPFEKRVPWQQVETATLTEHFMARRLTVHQYMALGMELGFTSQVTLYLVDGTWVTNPEQPQAIEEGTPTGARSLAMMAAGGPIAIRADKPSGECAGAFEARITAQGEDVTVTYTEDGSDPCDRNNPNRKTFRGETRLSIKGSGPHPILCHARDGAGNELVHSIAWYLKDDE